MADASSGEIVKLIAWTFERFLQLMGMDYQTGKDRYENIFGPAFLDMQQIHENYSLMIEKVRELLPNHIDEKYAYITEFDRELKPINYGVKVEIGGLKYLENRTLARDLVIKERDKNTHLRIEARKFSVEIIRKGHNKYEKAFCWAIINYFLDKNSFRNKADEQAFLSRLETQGYHQEIDTPSSLIKQALLDQKDTHKAFLYISGVKGNLNEKFLNLTHAYGNLKLNTYK
jgi:hypothetical protein